MGQLHAGHGSRRSVAVLHGDSVHGLVWVAGSARLCPHSLFAAPVAPGSGSPPAFCAGDKSAVTHPTWLQPQALHAGCWMRGRCRRWQQLRPAKPAPGCHVMRQPVQYWGEAYGQVADPAAPPPQVGCRHAVGHPLQASVAQNGVSRISVEGPNRRPETRTQGHQRTAIYQALQAVGSHVAWVPRTGCMHLSLAALQAAKGATAATNTRSARRATPNGASPLPLGPPGQAQCLH